MPWVSAVYWPYAYSDVFYYTFWPEAYEQGYWAYAYDDFFDGIYFPYGAPHVDYAYAGPYGPAGEGVTTGTAPSRQRTPAGSPEPGGARPVHAARRRHHGVADQGHRGGRAAVKRPEAAAR